LVDFLAQFHSMEKQPSLQQQVRLPLAQQLSLQELALRVPSHEVVQEMVER
jgi:hypothetical protein